MTRIDRRFKELRLRKSKAFIAYITAGDPSLPMTEKIVRALEVAGVDLVELGVPFSDPLADGPTIQAASQRALKKGVNLRKIFRTVGSLRDKTDIPVIFMTYYNPVLKYGPGNFFRDCRRYGVDGVIVPDLPYDEARALRSLASRFKIANILLAAPTSTSVRMRNIARYSSGFVYYVSLTGVTGSRKKLPKEINLNVKKIKSMTGKSVCVGFGVSTPAQAKEVATVADGVIVGSAIVKIIGDNQNNYKKLLSQVYKFTKSMARAIHND